MMNKLHDMNTNRGQAAPTTGHDLICFTHLRWDFVYQRPQHLLSRFAKERSVFVVEEPIFNDDENASMKVTKRGENLFIAVPHIPHGLNEASVRDLQRALLDDLISDYEIRDHVSWYYTPMMLAWSDHLRPLAVIYDCMDELSAFKNAPPALHEQEAELFRRANLVFTGGQSLFEAKRDRHHAVYAFPSSIDKDHFAQALEITGEMPDQENIPHPRIGYIGVIDERMDIELLGKIAGLKPEWNFVMIGPVVKIDEAQLPRANNIYYLGGKSYDELPGYIAGWDVAIMPFAMNESTRYISPTKTPEFLAAGCPVVSTPVRDVVRPYGDEGLVHIAETAEEFIAAIQRAMDEDADDRRRRAGEFLSGNSWDKTFDAMNDLINDAVKGRKSSAAA